MLFELAVAVTAKLVTWLSLVLARKNSDQKRNWVCTRPPKTLLDWPGWVN